ncbi:adhesion G-protein coupled receptor G6-like [Babylonia areolata]|uniref:adhesion G-protein coupled receptor G6-like n=1 Tax=Babylonia areolata TaxID=304850 RepID=UPI003FD3A91E
MEHRFPRSILLCWWVVVLSVFHLTVQASDSRRIEVRLAGGGNEGRVEVRRGNGTWGGLCYGIHWDSRVLQVVCRHLNLGFGRVIDHQSQNLPVYMEGLTCNGTESRLDNCNNTDWETECKEEKVAALHCQPLNCSGADDPRDFCLPSQSTELEARVAGGPSDTEGRLEIRQRDGPWTVVCEDGFDSKAAAVVCRELNLGIKGKPKKTSYSQNDLGMSPKGFYCDGRERNLGHCGQARLDSLHRIKTVGIRCYGGAPDPSLLLPQSSITGVLRNLTKTVTAETVEQTRDQLDQEGNKTAADVVLVADFLHRASQLHNVSTQMATDLLTIVDSVSEMNQSVLQHSNTVGSTTNKLIGSVEQLADGISLGEGGSARLQTNSTVLQVWDLASTVSRQPPIGIQMTSDGQTQDVTSDSDKFDSVDSAIFLPAKVVQARSESDVRLSACVIQRTSLFQASQPTDTATPTDRAPEQGTDETTSGFRLNSQVVSLRFTVDGQPVTNLSAFDLGTVTTVFKPRELLPTTSAVESSSQCVFWDFKLQEGHGDWSSEGCRLHGVVSGRVTCVCDHLTNFALLMDFAGQEALPRFHEDQLKMISLVGLTFSICGLSLTILAFILVRKLQKSLPQQTLFNMALAMLLSLVIFLAGVQRVQERVLCVGVAMALHYLILVTFLWTLAQAVLQYVMLVRGQARPFSRYMLKVAPPAWGLPVLPVITVSAIDVDLYRGGGRYCWMSPTPFYFAFLAPIGAIVVVNLVVYVLVVVSICRRPNLGTGGTSYTVIGVRASFSLFVSLGLTWMFAFFAVDDARVVFQYLFTVTTVFQGFLIFVLFTARDPAVKAFCLDAIQNRIPNRIRNRFRRGHISSGPDQGTPSASRAARGTKGTKETSFTPRVRVPPEDNLLPDFFSSWPVPGQK